MKAVGALRVCRIVSAIGDRELPLGDRALVLASLVRPMRDHFLAVCCSCGAGRVIAVSPMANDRRLADTTLAHMALRLSDTGCHDSPDEVHLTATIHGIGRPPFGSSGLVWTLPLVERPAGGAGRLRRTP